MPKLQTAAEVKKAMLEKLEGSLLDSKDASKLKLQPLTAADVKKLDVPVIVSGFQIPYFDLDGKVTKFWRLRYLEDTRKGFDVLNGRKSLRYVQPKGGVNEVYLPPFADWRKQAENIAAPIVITEGELKSACATKMGIPTIGLGGVYSFKSTKNGESLLPALRKFSWKMRQVIICYDSDAVSNNNVVIAENQLARALTQEGAVVHIARLPPGENGEKVGMDDYLLTHTADELLILLAGAAEYDKSRALHELNERFAYVRDPGFIYDYNAKMRIGAAPFTQHAHANIWHDEPQKDGTMKPVQTAPAWLKWPQRTELHRVTFSPGEPKIVNGELNMWDGWPIEPEKGDVKLWQALMHHLFSGAEPEARTWFEQWCAYPLQNPGVKMASCAVFWGRVQGSGKTLVGHTLMRIYGKYSAEITDTELEDERFDWAENLQFALGDDITGSNNRRLANRIKTMVTQKWLKINQKYIPRYSIPDCINYYWTSNDPDAFYMDDGDRRNFIHEVVAGKIEIELRKRFVEWRDSEAGIAALFYYFLNLDLTGFDPQAEPFVTDAKLEMTHLVKSDIGLWVSELRTNPERLKLPGDLFTAGELLMMYDAAGTGRVTANGMARELKRAGYRAPGNVRAVQTKSGCVRLYAVRNAEEWERASPKKIKEHYENSRSDTAGKSKTKF